MTNAFPYTHTQRSAFRLLLGAGPPVSLLFSLQGKKVDPIIEELGAGGARFLAIQDRDRFHAGQLLGPAVLVLPDVGMTVVYPMVKWIQYPQVGVQFLDMNETDRELVFRFLFRMDQQDPLVGTR